MQLNSLIELQKLNLEAQLLEEIAGQKYLDYTKTINYFGDISNKVGVLQKAVNNYCTDFEQGINEVNYSEKDKEDLEKKRNDVIIGNDKCKVCFGHIENPNQLNLCTNHFLQKAQEWKQKYGIDI